MTPDRMQKALGKRSSVSHPYAPLQLSLAWLIGTYLLFLVVGQVEQVTNLERLTVFISCTVAAFTIGYLLKMRKLAGRVAGPAPASETLSEERMIRRVTLLSGIYFVALALLLLTTTGATGPSSVLNSLLSPGDAYIARIRLDRQQAAEQKVFGLQILTLFSVLYTPLIPFLILYWRRIGLATRSIGISGILLLASYSLYIATLKGLGDLLVFFVVSILVLAFGNWRENVKSSRLLLTWIAVGTLILGAYMAYNQADRVRAFGSEGRFPANPVLSELTTESFARGLSVVAFYPTHGYLGLAKNLELPFEWASGRGSSRALDSYLAQYLGDEGVLAQTYPGRTEVATGWPAGELWSTIYPWLASDLTFPGAVFFMGIVGWWLARLWFEAAYQRSKLSLLLLSQVVILILFVPANNQVGITRTSLIAFISLCALYAIKSLRSRPGLGRQTSRRFSSRSEQYPRWLPMTGSPPAWDQTPPVHERRGTGRPIGNRLQVTGKSAHEPDPHTAHRTRAAAHGRHRQLDQTTCGEHLPGR
jgi:hypothetical protein